MFIVSPEELQDEREAKNLSRDELANLAALAGGRQHISKIERGIIDPKFSTMAAISRALGAVPRETQTSHPS